MSGDKGKALPIPPPSPAFALTSSWTPSAASRPEHSAVAIPLESTTPLIPPPETPQVTAGGAFDEKYSAYGDANVGGREGDALLRRRSDEFDDDESRRKGHRAVSPLETLVRLLLGMFAILGFLVLLARLSVLPEHQTARVAAYMPSPVRGLIQVVEGPTEAHPIIPLIREAREKWHKKLTSQSWTFDRATRTYKSRYGRAPPPGFDKWFAFATQGRNHSLVDEYDQLMEDLEPFRALSAAELRRRTAELSKVPGISIVSIRNGEAQVHARSSSWAPADAFQRMLAAFVRDLPDMDIAINERPEGRVLPRQQRHVFMSDYGLEGEELVANMSDSFNRPTLKHFRPEWKHDGSVWEAYRRSCPTDSAARRLVESIRSVESNSGLVVQGRASLSGEAPKSRRVKAKTVQPVTREMTFNQDLDAVFNMCDYPSMHTLHSAFYSDQRTIEHLFPVFSPSKPAGYADILIPSHHYWSPSSEHTYELELRRGQSKTPSDIDWSLKRDSSYWRGKVTRGADTPPGHGSSFQKQRLVKMANAADPNEQRVLVSLDAKTSDLTAMSVSSLVANKAMTDIAMACDPSLGECSYLRSLGYRVEPPAPLSDAWRHKIVLDVDEIGFSPRFPALMESKSAVVKSSIQREFWRGWAEPWKHFIPLSSSYSELYNIQSFFEGYSSSFSGRRGNSTLHTPTVISHSAVKADLPANADGSPFDNDRALRDIAEAGSEWRQRHLRQADMECYVFRLLIEWANLLVGDRPGTVASVSPTPA
ncbi:hypothetical protein B0A53_01254 [Rhodotorula sp. CCFEE 5036]|nr:hypothetical protein B0A53_01254 [Rhodotorula sp. CCFEE 5036]